MPMFWGPMWTPKVAGMVPPERSEIEVDGYPTSLAAAGASGSLHRSARVR